MEFAIRMAAGKERVALLCQEAGVSRVTLNRWKSMLLRRDSVRAVFGDQTGLGNFDQIRSALHNQGNSLKDLKVQMATLKKRAKILGDLRLGSHITSVRDQLTKILRQGRRAYRSASEAYPSFPLPP